MSPAPSGALATLEGSGLGQAMRQWLWLYPGVEIVHIVGIAVRLDRGARPAAARFVEEHSVRRLASHVLPWTAASFILIIPSGLAMFTAHATEFVQSEVFVLKMLLILAGVNAALFPPSRSAPPTSGILKRCASCRRRRWRARRGRSRSACGSR